MILVLQIAAGTFLGLTGFCTFVMVAAPWLASKVVAELETR